MEDIIKWESVEKREEGDLKPESWQTPNLKVSLEEESLQSKVWKSQQRGEPGHFEITKNNHFKVF